MRRVLFALALGVLASCSSGGDEPPASIPATSTPTASAPAATDSQASGDGSERGDCPGRPRGGSPAEFDAAGGVYAAYLTDFDPQELQASFDVVQWLTGDAARQAYEQETGDADGPPNDYYIRNENDRVRTAAVSPDATYWIVQLATDSDADVDRTDAARFAQERSSGGPSEVYWLTFDDGVIAQICEQYRP